MVLNILIFIIAIAVGILIYFLLKSVAILTGILGIIMGGFAGVYFYKTYDVYWLSAAVVGGIIGGILAFPGLIVAEASKKK